MVVIGQSACIRPKMLVFGPKWMYSGNMVVLGQNDSIRAKMVVFGKNCL